MGFEVVSNFQIFHTGGEDRRGTEGGKYSTWEYGIFSTKYKAGSVPFDLQGNFSDL